MLPCFGKVIYNVFADGDKYYEIFYGSGSGAGTISIRPDGSILQ